MVARPGDTVLERAAVGMAPESYAFQHVVDNVLPKIAAAWPIVRQVRVRAFWLTLCIFFGGGGRSSSQKGGCMFTVKIGRNDRTHAEVSPAYNFIGSRSNL